MSNRRVADEPRLYEIRVMGCLEPKWADWFDGLSITSQANDVTLLIGSIDDQAALHGVLNKIRDLGLPLLSMTMLESDELRGGAPAR